jgi:putative FmdB family regulatory protein
MPVYDYLCAECGAFTDMRPMADADLPHECPACGKDAPRAFLTAPYLAGMSTERRLAHATNERSASSPQVSSRVNRIHGSGCSCCSGKPLRAGKSTTGTRTKGFPARRPWMLSH